MPDSTLRVLRTFLGDARVDEIGEAAAAAGREYASVEELICFAEHLRLFAEARAESEGAEVLGGGP